MQLTGETLSGSAHFSVAASRAHHFLARERRADEAARILRSWSQRKLQVTVIGAWRSDIFHLSKENATIVRFLKPEAALVFLTMFLGIFLLPPTVLE